MKTKTFLKIGIVCIPILPTFIPESFVNLLNYYSFSIHDTFGGNTLTYDFMSVLFVLIFHWIPLLLIALGVYLAIRLWRKYV
ncbi:hypothetical protein [Nitrosopumilus piranensis]|uniref:Uncharacterized protein n=1 Tax=Nitrosopumilus piranensis TaxID=1582439 RepID=A0A0C5BXT0_9ARCH|nr:hypothetical protein [Nitrosopumilus piranensis]AJM93094.1 hypothetical protein NPIRD3C_1884 [Nitrosopumilus piranensis]